MLNGAQDVACAPQKIGLALGLSTYQLFHLALFRATTWSRGFFGFSALIFLRTVRFAFLRSSLLNFEVFAMSAV
jgi:hypothetical protein